LRLEPVFYTPASPNDARTVGELHEGEYLHGMTYKEKALVHGYLEV
jgi:hypothetical protein